MNVEAWAQYISFFAPTENVFSLGQGYAIDTGASGLPSECPPLAVEHRQYLAHKNGELQEITQHLHGDDARNTDKLSLTKELSGRLKSTVEELHAWPSVCFSSACNAWSVRYSSASATSACTAPSRVVGVRGVEQLDDF